MQFLVFHLGKDRYGLNTEHVVRVLPMLELKQLPKAPAYVAGLMNFHGKPVPVIDLCALAGGAPCARHFDTRILLVDYRAGDGGKHALGLVAERVAGIEQVRQDDFLDPGVSTQNTPYLGKIAARDGALLQLVNVDHLLTPQVRDILFPLEDKGAA